MNNKLKNAVVNNEYGRKPYVSDSDYQTFMEETPFKVVADQYKSAGVEYPESEFQQPYTDDSDGDDYQGVENNWQPPAFNLPEIPQLAVGVPNVVGGCYDLWKKLTSGIASTSASLTRAIAEYMKYCPLKFLGRECCKGIKIVGPDIVDSAGTAEYKMVGLNFACNYEADAKLGEITGSLSSFGTETYTAPTVSAKTTDTIKVTHWFSGEICATKNVIINPAGCDSETINITSTVMGCSESQTLSVNDAVVGKTYNWEVSSGSLSSSTGTSVTFTAPATNANCTSNTTVSLKVGANTCDTGIIAINCAGTGVKAYETWTRTTCTLFGAQQYTICYGDRKEYDCDGNLLGTYEQGTIDSSNPGTLICSHCYSVLEATNMCDGQPRAEGRYADCRSASQKAAGCCPRALA